MKSASSGFRLLIFFSLFFGLAYPAVVTLIGQSLLSDPANGSLIERDGVRVGSSLIAQKFTRDEYFWSRPSNGDYTAIPSGASNLGPTSAELLKQVNARSAKLRAENPSEPSPADLLFASASGLDPELSPAAASFQVVRIAAARHFDVKEVLALVEAETQDRQWGIFGEPRVNVLKLNLALDELSRKGKPR